jgi:hypothetical protein
VVQREDKQDQIGGAVGHRQGVGAGFKRAIAAVAMCGPAGFGNERIAAGHARAKRGESARQMSFATADVDDVQP